MSIWPSEVENPKRITVAGFFAVIPAKAGIQSLDPGSSPNAVDLSRMPLIQNPCFRRGLSLVIPAEAGIPIVSRLL